MERFDEGKTKPHNVKGLIFSEKFSLALVGISFLGLLGSIVVFIVCGNWSFSFILNEEKIAQFGDFIGGVIGTLLAFAASLLYNIALKEHQKDIKINQNSLDKQIDDMRSEILNFASSLSSGKKYNRESFKNIFKTYDKYEKILKENGWENGLVEESIGYIRETYRDWLKNGKISGEIK